MKLDGNNPDSVIQAILERGRNWSKSSREPDGKKIGLVIEGGAMRGVRSAGGLLALEAMGLSNVFDEVYGCSAGAVNACYFLSGQGAYGTTIYYQNINNRKFINGFRFHKVVDLDFMFDHVAVHEKPLLVERVINSPSQLYVSVTDVQSGTGKVIHVQKSQTPLRTLLKASSAMPVVYNEHVLVDGRRCIDGGVTNAIPLDAAIANGCTHILVLLTRPREYRNPDAGLFERRLFRATCGKDNDALCALHLKSDPETNRMRDLAFGRAPCGPSVNIATLAPAANDVAVDRTTTNAKRLKQAATQFANRTFRAFGADVDEVTEVLQPFKLGTLGAANRLADDQPAVRPTVNYSPAPFWRHQIKHVGPALAGIQSGWRTSSKSTRRRLLIVGGVMLVLMALTTHWVLKRTFAHVAPVGSGTDAVASQADVIQYTFTGPVGADGVPSPWQSRVITGSMNVEVVDSGAPLNAKALHVSSQGAHFVVYSNAITIDPKTHPTVSWDWKGAVLPTNGDVRTHGEFYYSSSNHNDAGLQVLVGFEGDDVLSYIWDSTAPVGTEVDEWSPVATIKTRVVESGSDGLNSWQHQSVNIYDDYKRRFGREPGKVIGVSVQTNSNHTSSSSDGMVGPISFGP